VFELTTKAAVFCKCLRPMKMFDRIVHGSKGNEGLDTFWKCLNGFDQKRWYANELYHRKNVDLGFLDDV